MSEGRKDQNEDRWSGLSNTQAQPHPDQESRANSYPDDRRDGGRGYRGGRGGNRGGGNYRGGRGGGRGHYQDPNQGAPGPRDEHVEDRGEYSRDRRDNQDRADRPQYRNDSRSYRDNYRDDGNRGEERTEPPRRQYDDRRQYSRGGRDERPGEDRPDDRYADRQSSDRSQHYSREGQPRRQNDRDDGYHGEHYADRGNTRGGYRRDDRREYDDQRAVRRDAPAPLSVDDPVASGDVSKQAPRRDPPLHRDDPPSRQYPGEGNPDQPRRGGYDHHDDQRTYQPNRRGGRSDRQFSDRQPSDRQPPYDRQPDRQRTRSPDQDRQPERQRARSPEYDRQAERPRERNDDRHFTRSPEGNDERDDSRPAGRPRGGDRYSDYNNNRGGRGGGGERRRDYDERRPRPSIQDEMDYDRSQYSANVFEHPDADQAPPPRKGDPDAELDPVEDYEELEEQVHSRGGRQPQHRGRPSRAVIHDGPEVEALFQSKHKQSGTGIDFDVYDSIEVDIVPKTIPPVNSFEDLKVHDLLAQNLARSGYRKPTPVQKYGVPVTLAGKDLMACAQTGSGKTVAFLIPIVNHILVNGVSLTRGRKALPLAIIMAPTRELAIQIFDESRKCCYKTDAATVVIYGGTSYNEQCAYLSTACDIIVATPGRLKDIFDRHRVGFSRVKFLVLDEADRMLELGFEEQVEAIVCGPDSDMPGVDDRQTMMYSATFPRPIQMLARRYMKKASFLLTVGRVGSTTKNITQRILKVEDREKQEMVLRLLNVQSTTDLVLIFVQTKVEADDLVFFLSSQNIPCAAIHGDRQQWQREQALTAYKKGLIPILVATDVASRGLDIPNVAHVIQYDLPNSLEDYIHRIGRTGRAGNKGCATSFFNRKSEGIRTELIQYLRDHEQDVPDWLEVAAMESARQSSATDSRRGGRRGGGGGGGGGGRSGGHSAPKASAGDEDLADDLDALLASAASGGGGGGSRGGKAKPKFNSNDGGL